MAETEKCTNYYTIINYSQRIVRRLCRRHSDLRPELQPALLESAVRAPPSDVETWQKTSPSDGLDVRCLLLALPAHNTTCSRHHQRFSKKESTESRGEHKPTLVNPVGSVVFPPHAMHAHNNSNIQSTSAKSASMTSTNILSTANVPQLACCKNAFLFP